jgi:Carboxypeptidase regulatory-like domain
MGRQTQNQKKTNDLCFREFRWEEAGMRFLFPFLKTVAVILLFGTATMAQETTGGLQGTVKDPSGAVVPNAKVVVTGSAMVGSKALLTDGSGYYRFANLPPGSYTITITATGFKTFKREGVILEVGHLPSVDISLEVGVASSIVEVSSAAPVIDTTTTQNMTNVTNDVIANIPHGLSYQSVIQFAPMARNEPLAGFTVGGMGNGGTGGSLPGSSGNGLTFGYSIGGAADSENSYLVEGQDTEQLSGGYSKANVPFQFIQEVQLKTSGIESEYGGALGGVVNVVMKKGANQYHGEVFSTYESNGLDANNNNIYLRYDPAAAPPPAGFDPGAQLYNPRQDQYHVIQPGFTLGGPIKKDRLWFFVGFAPQVNALAKTVNFGGTTGNQYFTQDRQTYYATGRLDASLTSKIRLYASWLYQHARERGVNLPVSDPVASEAGFLNTSTGSPLSAFSYALGWAAPNSTYNVGADVTLTPKVVSTTRFGYFFENYHDFGWQTQTPNLVWSAAASGVGAVDNAGNPLPAGLQQPGGTTTAPYTSTFTPFNANKHYQFNQDVAFFKGGWWGTHNFKIGYQLNHLVNVISQNGNVPQAFLTVGQGHGYSPSTTTGAANCAALTTAWGVCAGQYGYLTVQDFATVLPTAASDWNHALFAQDSWTVGHGLTLNLGIRVEKETLPPPGGVKISSIDFPWTDKVAPRLGVAWDPTGHAKMKIFGSYGVVNDVMKLLVAQTSWGAQVFEDCTYALGPNASGGFSVSDIDLVFKNGRACPSGPVTLDANFASGSVPASLKDAKSGVSLIENVNFRPAEPIAPGVKPYRQHEYVAGWDYQISRSLAFEARYDRRRLDHVIEDSSLADPTVGELYTIVNPGEGVNRTLDGYAAFLQSLGQAFLVPGYSFNSAGNFGTCPTCPPMPKAIRNYDGVEFRLTKAPTKSWAGMFSYTYSRLWGNYAGLTTTDQIDGNATGRNSPDTSRSFDEPFYYYGANGKSTNGLLPTDRPSVFKGTVYYQLPWKGMNTTFGIFQYAYQGTPVSSYTDLAAAFFGIPYESTYIFGRGKWANITQDPTTGAMTFGTPYDRRTPWFTQTDFNFSHSVKVKETRSLRFEASFINLLNQHAVLQYYEGFNSINFETPLAPGVVTANCPPPAAGQPPAAACPVSLSSGAALYQTLEGGYNPQQWVNGATVVKNGTTVNVPNVIKHSWYGLPQQYQLLRNIRLGFSFTF